MRRERARPRLDLAVRNASHAPTRTANLDRAAPLPRVWHIQEEEGRLFWRVADAMRGHQSKRLSDVPVRPFVVVVFRTALRCVLPRPPARLVGRWEAAAVFCDPPTSPSCVLSGGGLLLRSPCVRRAPLCFLLLLRCERGLYSKNSSTPFSFPSYQREKAVRAS